MYVCEKKAPTVAPEYSDKTMGVRVSTLVRAPVRVWHAPNLFHNKNIM